MNVALVVRYIRSGVRVPKHMLHSLVVVLAIGGGDLLTELKALLGNCFRLLLASLILH